jgi:hypothetical protein
VRGDKWFDLGSPYGMPGRQGTQDQALKNSKQATGHLKISLVAGEVERDQDAVG